MNNYTETLADPTHAGVYEIPQDGLNDIVEAATSNGQLVYRVDLRNARNKEHMLQIIGEAMELPEWYGANFDALVDCLCDLSWREATGHTVIMENCHNINLIAHPDFNMLLDIFAEVAQAWREKDQPFWCFVDLPSNT